MRLAGLAAIPALAAALFFLLPCSAFAQEEPEAVYGKYHQALRAGNFEVVKQYAAAESRKQITAIPAGERDAMLALIKAIMPQSYAVSGKEPGADGKSLTLRATGMGTNLGSGKPDAMAGVIRMLKEGSDWKVEKADWHSANQRGLPPPDPANPPVMLKPVPKSTPKKQPPAAAAPKAPERSLGTAKEPCVYKPVMTNEDMERCR
jgi:hypothetical protein